MGTTRTTPTNIMKKRQDWKKRLVKTFQKKRRARFHFGTHDCCITYCDLVKAMTDTDIAEEIRGYLGGEEAGEVLDIRGGVEKIVEQVTKKYGMEEIDPAFATAGDAIIFEEDEETVLGFITPTDPEFIGAAGKRGFSYTTKDKARRAWKVPY